MKYTWRILISGTVILGNSINYYSTGEVSFSSVFSIFLNAAIGWLIGLQIDNYRISRKELGSTKTVLLDYSFAMDSVAEAIGIMNDTGKFIFVNEGLANLYGYSKEELLSRNWKDCYTTDTLEYLNRKSKPDLLEKGFWKGETIGLKKDGTTFTQEISISHIKESQNTICVVRDITVQKNYEEHIKYIAEHNDLTGLPNRRRLLSDLDYCENNDIDTSLLFLDLDRFKLINDNLGHDFGDELLKNVADKLRFFENEFIHVYHHGGDEFIIIILDKDVDFVSNLAYEIINKIKIPYPINGKELFITASIGISRYPEYIKQIYDLIKTADTAMYYAKLEGKDTYKFFTKDLQLQQDRKAIIDAELRKAIKNEEFFIEYQPKIDLKDFEIIGMEALLRWKHPKLGFVPPAEFIPIAEETGLIQSIGNWVIHEVLDQMRKWQDRGYPLVKVSVNVSQRQFRDKELIQTIRSCLQTFSIDPKYFEVEITESVLEDLDLMIPTIHALKQIGIGISIDDFGTGFSSLNILKDLPIDTLKIDQSFIRDLLTNSKDYSLVKTILEIGKNLGLEVVAEGIETNEQVNHLLKLKCCIGQGYYFSKPITADELEIRFLNKLTYSI
jgi:diguanylate cyclase